MKHYKLVTYILLFSLIWISCDNDKTAPSIAILSPLDGTLFNVNDVLLLEFTATDNEELESSTITIIDPSGIEAQRTIDLSGTTQTAKEEFLLDYNTSGTINVKIEVFDKAGNVSFIEKSFDFNYFKSGTLEFNIKLQYQGQPLVIFNDYNYPDGRKMNFTRVSFYTSEMKLNETPINEVEFHNLTNSHSNLELANQGYFWSLENVPTGTYDNLSFNIGVPEALNNRDPGEFPSGHPLAKPAENWFSWMSYIFLKVEGNIDLNNDGDSETGIALHTGSNEALRRLTIDYPIQVNENENTKINLIFDLYQLFDGPTGLFPIDEYPQIHSLTQLEGVLELSNNLINSIHK